VLAKLSLFSTILPFSILFLYGNAKKGDAEQVMSHRCRNIHVPNNNGIREISSRNKTNFTQEVSTCRASFLLLMDFAS